MNRKCLFRACGAFLLLFMLFLFPCVSGSSALLEAHSATVINTFSGDSEKDKTDEKKVSSDDGSKSGSVSDESSDASGDSLKQTVPQKTGDSEYIPVLLFTLLISLVITALLFHKAGYLSENSNKSNGRGRLLP